MDEQRVYALTAKGNAELMGASTSLGAPELKLLVLVDGRASIAQRAQLAPHAVGETLQRLVASGHVVSAADVHSDAIDPGALFSESDAGVAALRAKGYFVRIARRAPLRPQPAAGQKLTVLVIEDDPQLVKLLRTYLQMEDFEVRIAATREEINAALRAQPTPHLVLLDVVLPDIDGFEVLAKMRQHEAVKNVPKASSPACSAARTATSPSRTTWTSCSRRSKRCSGSRIESSRGNRRSDRRVPPRRAEEDRAIAGAVVRRASR